MFTTILILIFLGFLLYLCNFGKVGIISAVLILCLACHIWCCSNLAWYGEKVVAPEIEIKIQESWYSWLKSDELEPLLGEEIRQGEDGNYYLTLTDHALSAESGDYTPNLEIFVGPDNATLKKANLKFTITEVAPDKKSSESFWQNSGSATSQSQTITMDKNFKYEINGSTLRMNEDANVEPTKYIFAAKNVAGETRKTLIITRRPLYQACEFYERDHPGRVATDDIKSCHDRAEKQHRSIESQAQSTNSGTNSNQNSTNSSSSLNSHSSAKTTCLHYESGRCWGDLEMEAYSQGQYDKIYGYYGDSYYESDNCDSICQSILEDAYDEGYSDY